MLWAVVIHCVLLFYTITSGKGGGHSWVYRSVVGFSRYIIHGISCNKALSHIHSSILFQAPLLGCFSILHIVKTSFQYLSCSLVRE